MEEADIITLRWQLRLACLTKVPIVLGAIQVCAFRRIIYLPVFQYNNVRIRDVPSRVAISTAAP